jgi:hypothetical protein
MIITKSGKLGNLHANPATPTTGLARRGTSNSPRSPNANRTPQPKNAPRGRRLKRRRKMLLPSNRNHLRSRCKESRNGVVQVLQKTRNDV